MNAPLTNLESALQKERMISDWAKYTVKRLQESINKATRSSRALMESIERELVKSGGDIERVIIKFLQYGRFYDMGVGRGVPIGLAGSGLASAARDSSGFLRQRRRRPVKWFSKTYYSEVQRFNELYTEMFREGIPVAIAEAMEQVIAMNP